MSFELTDFHIFKDSFLNSSDIEILVSTEFGSQREAELAAHRYAYIMGQMPRFCRSNVFEMVLYPTGWHWTAFPGSILIHDGNYEADLWNRILEETMLHECVHAVIDREWLGTHEWALAQGRDGEFISDYAFDFPSREDLAESFVPYFGLAMRPHRLSEKYKSTVQETMPNRLEFFRQNFPLEDLGL